MGYYIKKTGLSGKTVYWTGGSHWSDDSSKKKTYVNKGTCLLYTSDAADEE